MLTLHQLNRGGLLDWLFSDTNLKRLLCYFCLCLQINTLTLKAIENDPNVNSTADLEWGTVLFDYYQGDYLSALIEYEYVKDIGNKIALSANGNLLKGGMLLSYGMAEPAESIFLKLLNESTPIEVRNSAWFYLANLYYHKSEDLKAYNALEKVNGKIDTDLHTEYHYLATLISNQGKHLKTTEKIIDSLPKDSPHFAYILFNYAITQLEAGEKQKAIMNLDLVAKMGQLNPELSTLADRARHGLAQIMLEQGDTLRSWEYLKSIRTSGLYSNRALLTYAWTAIKLQQFNQAIPALAILDQRSISIPETQEAKVLLAHLFEQEGSPRKALKSNLLAIDAFEGGLEDIAEARSIIAKQDVPKEFIVNFEAIVGLSDWYAIEPTVEYSKLTPFVIDLTASKVFNETLKELSELYTIQNNLRYWSTQAEQHLLILKNTKQKRFEAEHKKIIGKATKLTKRLKNEKSDLKLFALTLEESEQTQLESLVDSTSRELEILNSRIDKLKQTKTAYQQPKKYQNELVEKHREVKQKLAKANQFVATLEPVMRSLINSELDKHQNRMSYYLAQSRLAKARLYDSTLMDIKKAKSKLKQAPMKDSGEAKNE